LRVPSELLHVLRTSDDFFLATHKDPEGDALGSSLALHLALRSMGKKSVVFNRDLVPALYRYLPQYELVSDVIPESVNNLVLMDCNSLQRAGLEECNIGFSVVIDHHRTQNNFGDVRWIEPDAPATGLMVFYVIKELGVEISKDMAVNLYSAIGIDTGIFRYSNTTAECLSVASELVTKGADPGIIADRLYNTYSRGRFLLLEKSLENLEIFDTIAVFAISEDMYRDTGTSSEDTESFVNFPLKIEDIKISVLLRQIDEGQWKVSLRSKGDIDIASVAVLFGGGGHRNAAGCIISAGIADAKRLILEKIRKIVP
jgi:phosphoesterase RecJ-like protein